MVEVWVVLHRPRGSKRKRVASLTVKVKVSERDATSNGESSVLSRLIELADKWAERQPVDDATLEKCMQRTDGEAVGADDLSDLLKALDQKPGRGSRRVRDGNRKNG